MTAELGGRELDLREQGQQQEMEWKAQGQQSEDAYKQWLMSQENPTNAQALQEMELRKLLGPLEQRKREADAVAVELGNADAVAGVRLGELLFPSKTPRPEDAALNRVLQAEAVRRLSGLNSVAPEQLNAFRAQQERFQ